MQTQWLRDSFFGQCLRSFDKKSWLAYPEELPSWEATFDDKDLPFDSDNTIHVDWYSADDEENPHNWSPGKKAFVLGVIGAYSFVVYMAAAIYSSSQTAFVDEFHVNNAEGALGLAIYVLGYGAGPMLFSPLSEIPRIGRNLPYVISFALYCIISVPTALPPSANGFYVLRFLQGFFGSPCLATGGASIADIYSPDILPHAMTTWVLSVFCAPPVGVLISGFAIPVLGWRFSMWEILIAAAPILILLLLLPETSSTTILHRRARRLQQHDKSGVRKYHTAAEITNGHISLHAAVRESLLIPSKITILDPAILFLNCYTSLTYGIFYSFFEAFPLVYGKIYGFNLGEQGLAFLAIVVGSIISFAVYNHYIYRVYAPKARASKKNNNGNIQPESVLVPALFTCIGPSIGLFLFGWAARPEVHWIVSMIGIAIYPGCVFILMQCIFLYVPACYPHYAASVFAATDFTRSAFACGAVLFSRPMYEKLGIGPACSLLAGLTILCAVGVHMLYRYGEALRRRSKFEKK
ncbi:major facilitator superfamily domain-containing protein [Aspergillus karnatakaensis]|uniref:MFS transporter n=1 Tax=Aspergillus karnatakaensis TaxID=1810916 RepID=UPI003CCCE60A